MGREGLRSHSDSQVVKTLWGNLLVLAWAWVSWAVTWSGKRVERCRGEKHMRGWCGERMHRLARGSASKGEGGRPAPCFL